MLDQAGFWTSTDNLDYWKSNSVEDLGEDMSNLIAAGTDRLASLSFDGSKFDQAPVPGTVEGGVPTAELDGIMNGGDVVKVTRADGSAYYAIRYSEGGIEHLYSFDSKAQAEKAVGSLDNVFNMDEADVDDGDTWLLGSASGFIGLEGTYATYFSDAMQEAALEAGIRNPGKIGKYLSQPEIQRIIAMGAAGDWSDERVQAEVRRTEYYTEVLYPGISNYLDAGTFANPEQAWRNYHNNVSQSLDSLGYAKDDDGSYSTLIGEMLDKGIGDEEFMNSASIFVRAEQSPEFAATLNQWIANETGKDMTFDEWFDVLAGTTDPELDLIVEKATLQFQADQTNLFLAPSQITRIANMTQFSEAQVAANFTVAEQQLLAIGTRNLSRFGLSEEALVSASFGLGSGDETNVETRRAAKKAILELGLEDDDKAEFFLGFNASSRPVRAGLAAAAPEAG
jgi:hypothetical protein